MKWSTKTLTHSKDERMKVLVTGGAGYVGSHCVKLLVDRGHSVVVFDNLKFGHVQAVSPDAKLVRGDLLERPNLRALFAEHRFVVVLHTDSLMNVG